MAKAKKTVTIDPVTAAPGNLQYIYRQRNRGSGWYFNRQILGQVYRVFFGDDEYGGEAAGLKAAKAERAWFEKHYDEIKTGVERALKAEIRKTAKATAKAEEASSAAA